MPYRHVPAEAMTPVQLEKRERILDAVLRLLEDEDPARMSVKSVSLQSGVALGTLYRFFVSKEHLLAAALLHWEGPLVRAATALEADLAIAPDARIMRLVRQGTRAYQVNPNMLSLLVVAATSQDSFAREIMTEMRRATGAALGAQTPDLAAQDAALVGEVVQSLWFDVLVSWYAQRRTLTDGLLLIESTVAAVVHGFATTAS